MQGVHEAQGLLHGRGKGRQHLLCLSSHCCGGHRRQLILLFIQVNLGEEEPEDIAVRRFMKAVMESKVIEQVRGAARIWGDTHSDALCAAAVPLPALFFSVFTAWHAA